LLTSLLVAPIKTRSSLAKLEGEVVGHVLLDESFFVSLLLFKRCLDSLHEFAKVFERVVRQDVESLLLLLLKRKVRLIGNLHEAAEP